MNQIGNQFDCIKQCNSNWERIGFEFGTNSLYRIRLLRANPGGIGSGHGSIKESASRNFESHRTRLWFPIRIGLDDCKSSWLITVMNKMIKQSIWIESFWLKTYVTSETWLVTRQVRKILFSWEVRQRRSRRLLSHAELPFRTESCLRNETRRSK